MQRRGGLSVAPLAPARMAAKVVTPKVLPWQVAMALWMGVVGPPVASLILMTTIYSTLSAGRTEAIGVCDLVLLYALFAIPVGYVFGSVPAFLTGAMYCVVLTAVGTSRPGILLRVCVAAICAALTAGIWFDTVLGTHSVTYGAVATLVAALLSVRRPRKEHNGSLPVLDLPQGIMEVGVPISVEDAARDRIPGC